MEVFKKSKTREYLDTRFLLDTNKISETFWDRMPSFSVPRKRSKLLKLYKFQGKWRKKILSNDFKNFLLIPLCVPNVKEKAKFKIPK